MPRGRHQPAREKAPRRGRRLAALSVAGTLAGTALVGLTPTAASADIARCVGLPSETVAFACYTSPRFDQSGFDRSYVAIFPSVCYGLGCTVPESTVYTPDGNAINGRFIALLYLGHTYNIYRPADNQPYIVTSDNPTLTPTEQTQIMAFTTVLEASGV